VPEELALEECLRQRGAVDGHERSCRALAPGVDGARGDLLADAALAQQQDGRVGARDLAQGILHGLHRRVAPGEPAG